MMQAKTCLILLIEFAFQYEMCFGSFDTKQQSIQDQTCGKVTIQINYFIDFYYLALAFLQIVDILDW